jgi:hypothetical protein
MPQFLEEFPEIDSQNSGASFKKGLLTAMIELGAFLGKRLSLRLPDGDRKGKLFQQRQ